MIMPAAEVRGEVLAGRFRIIRFNASGGIGEVYEAEDQELREHVAVKTIRPEILGAATVSLFSCTRTFTCLSTQRSLSEVLWVMAGFLPARTSSTSSRSFRYSGSPS
jgi:hypothetical protein